MNAFLLAGIVVGVVALGEVGRLSLAARRARTSASPLAGVGWLFAGFSLAVAILAVEAAILGVSLARGNDGRSGLAALLATIAMAGGVAWIDHAWDELRAATTLGGTGTRGRIPARLRDRTVAEGIAGEASAILGFGILLLALLEG